MECLDVEILKLGSAVKAHETVRRTIEITERKTVIANKM
jgi:hypothetical protein